MPNLVSILLVIGLGPEAHCVCCSLVAVKQREPEDDESDTFALTVVCDFEKVAPHAIWARGQLNLELHAANQESTFLLMIYDFWGKQSTTTHFYYLQAHMNQIQPNTHSSNITHTGNIRSQGVWERRTSCDFAISVASSSHKKSTNRKIPICGCETMRAYGHILDSKSSTSNARCCRISSAFTSETMCNSGPRFG